MSLHTFPNRPGEATARRQAYDAAAILSVHYPTGGGYCRCLRNLPCSVRQTAARRHAEHRATLALTGGTEFFPILQPSGRHAEHRKEMPTQMKSATPL